MAEHPSWLIEQAKRDDWVGEVARHLMEDPNWLDDNGWVPVEEWVRGE